MISKLYSLLFYSKNSGEFIADFMVVVDKDEYDAKTNEMTIEKALKNTANGGRLGSLYLDPDSLTIREPSKPDFFFLNLHIHNIWSYTK